MEEKIKCYYIRCEKIKILRNEIENLNKFKNKIVEDIKKTNIQLDYSINTVSYTTEKVKTNIKKSPQEQALIKAVLDKEKQIEDIKIKIQVKNDLICKLEIENIEMKSIIERLDEESRIIFEGLYKNRYGSIKIGFVLHVDGSTARRKKQRILYDILKMYDYTC